MATHARSSVRRPVSFFGSEAGGARVEVTSGIDPAASAINPAFRAHKRPGHAPTHGGALCNSFKTPLDRFSPKWGEDFDLDASTADDGHHTGRMHEVRREIAQHLVDSDIVAIYNLVGHGSKNQIADLNEARRELDKLVGELNQIHKPRNGLPTWGVCYGGDPADEKKPDIGWIARYLAKAHSVKVIAIQCSEYAAWMCEGDGKFQKSYDFLHSALVYKTEKYVYWDGGQRKEVIMFGGYDPTPPTREDHRGGLVGTTCYIRLLLEPLRVIKGMVAMGGGPTSLDEMKEFFFRGHLCRYIRVKAKNPLADASLHWGVNNHQLYGPVARWVDFHFGESTDYREVKAGGVILGAVDDKWFTCNRFYSDEAENNPRNIPVSGNWSDVTDKVGKKKMTIFKQTSPRHWTACQLAGVPGRPVYVDAKKMQRDVFVTFTIMRLRQNEMEPHCEFTFRFELMCPVPDGMLAEDAVKRENMETWMPEITWNNLLGDLSPAWDPDDLLPSFFPVNFGDDLVDIEGFAKQNDYTKSAVQERKFMRLDTVFTGNFLQERGGSLGCFPYDLQLFQLSISAGDANKFAIKSWSPQGAKALSDFSRFCMSWQDIVHTSDSGSGYNGYSEGDPWCGFLVNGTPGADTVDEGIDDVDGRVMTTAVVSCALSRISAGIFYNLIFPSTVLTLSSLLIFCIPVDDDGSIPAIGDERLAVGFTILLTFVALKLVVMEKLPELPYLTIVDKYLLWCMLYVVIVIGTNAVLVQPAASWAENASDLKERDRNNLYAAVGAWIAMHLYFVSVVYYNYKRKEAFLGKNSLEIKSKKTRKSMY